MTEKLVIQGGCPLNGSVRVSGAKNSVLKLMAASLLNPHPIELTNVPNLTDVSVMTDVIRHLGSDVTASETNNKLCLTTPAIKTIEAPYELVSKMRASFNVLGALLGRCGEARVPMPGGCSIGKRGIDLHAKGLKALGAELTMTHGYVEATAKKLTGAEIMLDMPSMGATENIMMAAVFAEGTTVISNAAQEPEIVDLANFLNAMGADIHDAGTHDIVIHGVSPDNFHSIQYRVLPDRIEAATYLIAVAGTTGDVLLEDVYPAHLQSLLFKLADMGAEVGTPSPNSIQLSVKGRLLAQDIVTQPYPGFPTDLQAPMMALLTVCEGNSVVRETIYENRFKQIGELKRMGAMIEQEGNMAVITGVDQLSGAPVRASDLRAGAALVIAGLLAEGTTEIHDLQHLDRGYEQLVEKFQAIGANIRRMPSEFNESSQPETQLV